VHNERGFVRFMATMVAYGFFGNVIQQSDSWRIFGPLRYSLAGFFQFMRNTSYHTELTITQPSNKDDSKAQNDKSVKQRENSKVNERTDAEKSSLPVQIKREGRYGTINCLNMPCRCDKSNYGMSPFVHLGMIYI
jgi:ceramide kinase